MTGIHGYQKDGIAEDFNHFFASVGNRTADATAKLAAGNNLRIQATLSPNRLLCDQSQTEELFNFSPVTCEDVRHIISSMPTNKSPGSDKVSVRVIKHCLKQKVALKKFSDYLQRNSRLCFHQSGNKKHYSTETLNILVTNFLLNAMDNKRLSALILLDLSKAFDSISHSILLQKLNHIGASSSAVNWFKSYLSGRTQTVRIGSIVSTPISITNGVPQGAILSPFLFSIYLNDFPSVPHVCNLKSYVDDSKIFLFFPIKDVETANRNLQENLSRVATWCCKNQLLINPEKTKFLLIRTHQLLYTFTGKLSLISRQRQLQLATQRT